MWIKVGSWIRLHRGWKLWSSSFSHAHWAVAVHEGVTYYTHIYIFIKETVSEYVRHVPFSYFIICMITVLGSLDTVGCVCNWCCWKPWNGSHPPSRTWACNELTLWYLYKKPYEYTRPHALCLLHNLHDNSVLDTLSTLDELSAAGTRLRKTVWNGSFSHTHWALHAWAFNSSSYPTYLTYPAHVGVS